MFEHMENIYLGVVLAPLFGSIIAGLFGKIIGRRGAHWVTIIGVGIAVMLSAIVYHDVFFNNAPAYNGAVYTWLTTGGFT
ncbi:MAG: NADH:ubiquinone oxidoreductase subunit L, partial [Gammaproteobacteria bacterium]|nr:NADH:ubiquinone oxidoreductase subunit L [Gammaproteobacteria bacterium]